MAATPPSAARPTSTPTTLRRREAVTAVGATEEGSSGSVASVVLMQKGGLWTLAIRRACPIGGVGFHARGRSPRRPGSVNRQLVHTGAGRCAVRRQPADPGGSG